MDVVGGEGESAIEFFKRIMLSCKTKFCVINICGWSYFHNNFLTQIDNSEYGTH